MQLRHILKLISVLIFFIKTCTCQCKRIQSGNSLHFYVAVGGQQHPSNNLSKQITNHRLQTIHYLIIRYAYDQLANILISKLEWQVCIYQCIQTSQRKLINIQYSLIYFSFRIFFFKETNKEYIERSSLLASIYNIYELAYI